MSIQSLIGLPGHGKSYSAIELFILQAAIDNRPITTNIPTTEKLLEDFPNLDLTFIDLDKAKVDETVLNGIVGGSLVLLDELWRIWPAGMKANTIPIWQLAFIKEHRHKLSADGREMDIVLVTQDLSDIASAIRSMTETTIICTKLTDVGQKGRFRRDYYRGAVKGFTGPQNAFIRSDHGCKYQPAIYDYYKSHTKSEGNHAHIDNSGVVNATIFNGWPFKIGVIFLVLMIVGIFFLISSTKKGIEETTKQSKVANSDKEQITPITNHELDVPVVPVAPPLPKESTRFKLVGSFIDGISIKYYLISDGQKTRRIEPSKCTKGLNDVCLVDNEIIASYTGPVSGGSLLSYSVNPDAIK